MCLTRTMRPRRIIDSPGSDVFFLLVTRKANEDVFLNGVRAGKSRLFEQVSIEGSLSVTDVATVVSGDNDRHCCRIYWPERARWMSSHRVCMPVRILGVARLIRSGSMVNKCFFSTARRPDQRCHDTSQLCALDAGAAAIMISGSAPMTASRDTVGASESTCSKILIPPQ